MTTFSYRIAGPGTKKGTWIKIFADNQRSPRRNGQYTYCFFQ